MELKMKLAREQKPQPGTGMWQRYTRAERLLPGNAPKLTSDLLIKPRWIGESDRFWYRWKSLNGSEFVLVDPLKGERQPAFDHNRLAAALSQAAGTAVNAGQLPFSEIEFTNNGQSIVFDIDVAGASGRWSCELNTYDCMRLGDVPQSSKGQSAFARWAMGSVYARS